MKVKCLVALSYLLFACSSSAPATYSQMAPGMAPPPPRAPAFNPALDAPHTTGMPNHLTPQPSLPRTPYGRVLPETPKTRSEPGIWAAEVPKASLPSGPPRILGVLMPAPKSLDSLDDFHARSLCAAPMDTAVRSVDKASLLSRLPVKVTQCFALWLYSGCLAQLRGGLEQAKRTGAGHNDDVLAHVAATQTVAMEALRKACDGIDLSKALEDLANAALAEWDRMAREAP